MRIDVYLKVAGIIKTRSRAGKACRGGYVKLNGSRVKPASSVAVGDMIEVSRPRGDTIKLAVDEIPDSRQVSRRDRRELYTIIGEERPC